MKRPDTGKTFLDLEDICKILPESLKLEKERHSRGVYRASNGCLISISNSKEYTKGYLAWYYVYADRYAEIKWNCTSSDGDYPILQNRMFLERRLKER